jgi:putative hydrolase of the HAD superfamily
MGRIFADLRPEPSVIAAAAAARRAGIKVAILSNSVGLTPWNLYDGYEVEEGYDALVLSEACGMRKPEPELGFATVHAVEPARTVAALEALLGIELTDKDPGRVL